MNRTPCFRLVLVAATLMTLFVIPLAEARPLEIPRAAHQAVEGWFQAALRWLDSFAVVQHAKPAPKEWTPGTPQPVGFPSGGGNSTTGGSCFDPHGHCGA